MIKRCVTYGIVQGIDSVILKNFPLRLYGNTTRKTPINNNITLHQNNIPTPKSSLLTYSDHPVDVINTSCEHF